MDSAGEYRAQLESLQKIRSLAGAGNCALDLPQICVVGDQSSGKSALLGEITGINFPVNAGICTKAPIVVECKCEQQAASDIYEVMHEGVYTPVDKAEHLAYEITQLQQEALVHEAVKISKKEVRVRVRGPQQVDLIVVDLPGIINQGDGEAETKQLINKYIEKEQTLILLVSEAKQDDELCTAIGMTKQVDHEANRTLRVFTKCDTFDSDEAKQRALQRVRDDHHEKLHPHAVVCRVQGRPSYDQDEEARILTDMGLPDARAGVTTLKERLPPLFAELIRTNLPVLEANIKAICQETTAKLREIGEEPQGASAMLRECHLALQKSAVCMLEEPISMHMTAFQTAIHATQEMVTQEWSDAKLKPNHFECPFFQGGDALDSCMKDITQWWAPALDTYCTEVEKISRAHIQQVLTEQVEHMIPACLKQVIAAEWDAKCDELFYDLKQTFRNRLKKEIPWGTLNHYLTAKFGAEEILPQGLAEEIVVSLKRKLDADVKNHTPWANHTDAENREALNETLKIAKKRFSVSYGAKTLYEQQQQRLFHAVKAVWAVEHKTFIDYILKETVEHLMQPRDAWLATALFTNEKIKHAAVEDPAMEQTRQELKERLACMHKCTFELQRMHS